MALTNGVQAASPNALQPIQGMIAIAAGGGHTCALTVAGGVQCWGANQFGQLGAATAGSASGVASEVSSLSSGVSAIAAGEAHTCALIAPNGGAGGVQCWGANNYGQLGDDSVISRSIPVEVNGLSSGVIALSAGYYHACALTSASGVRCWGANNYGQLGDGTNVVSRTTPVEVSGLSSGVRAIAAGDYFTCALTDAGGVKCWGDNRYGQLGDGSKSNRNAPVEANNLSSGVKAIAGGWGHSCALLNNGSVQCWGRNYFGQLGDGSRSDRSVPVEVQGLNSVASAITAGYAHTCALTDVEAGVGGLRCWGQNFYGQLGDGSTDDRSRPVAVNDLSNDISAVAAGDFHTCALTGPIPGAGGVKCWGYDQDGQLGDGNTGVRTAPAVVNRSSSAVGDITLINAGDRHNCSLNSAGGVECWGANDDGQLGDASANDRNLPVAVGGLSSGVSVVSSGGAHSCAVVGSTIGAGSVQCWGANDSGQLGNGNTVAFTIPVTVENLGAIAATVSSGGKHSCALTSTRRVKCWGANAFGQLGDGTSFNNKTLPVDVSGLESGVSAIATGDTHTCALVTQSPGVSNALCWGDNRFGQLGDGTITAQNRPITNSAVSSNVSIIVAGARHTCAVVGAGNVQCWGNNEFGQLGNGATAFSQTTPVAVTGLDNVVALAAGGGHTCALLGPLPGSVRCWGKNDFGQLGDGGTEDHTTPTAVVKLSSVANAITAGANHTCALLSDSSVVCWGANASGQLGDGSAWRTTPVNALAFSPLTYLPIVTRD